MAVSAENGGGGHGIPWRLIGWGAAAALLLLPLVAMQFTDEVAWSLLDFAVMAALFGAVGLGFELAVRKTGNAAYRSAAGIALAAAFLLIWLNLAVGIIGREDDPANLMFVGVLAIAVIGAVFTRFEPAGMARAMLATAIAQALVAVVALLMGHLTAILIALFVALWLVSAVLFAKAAREQAVAL